MLGGLTFLYMHEGKRFIDCAFHSLCVIVSGSPGLENPSLAACLVLKVLVETIPSARCSKCSRLGGYVPTVSLCSNNLEAQFDNHGKDSTRVN